MINNEFPKKKNKLSRRPLRRIIQFQCEIGPYGSPSAQRYVLWTSEIPKGKRKRRFMSCVQRVTRPSKLGDQIHNPLIFEKVVWLRDDRDSEFQAKYCYRRAQRAMYYTIKDLLVKMTRPMIHVGIGEDRQTHEPGASTDTLGRWRRETMQQIGGHYLGCWEQIDAEQTEYAAQEARWKAQQAAEKAAKKLAKAAAKAAAQKQAGSGRFDHPEPGVNKDDSERAGRDRR